MATATEKVHVVRLLPTGNSQAARTERAHLQGSRWLIPGANNGEGVAGRVYHVTHDVAASLLRKGWLLCDAYGKPLAGEVPELAKAEVRNGTAAWYALAPEDRPGTEEYREAQLERRLREAYAVEQANLTAEHGKGAHTATPIEDCPVCAGEAVDAAAQGLSATDGAQGRQEGSQTVPDGQSGVVDGSQTAPGGQSGVEAAQSAPAPRRVK